jgi:hypothetical protein
MGVASAIDSPDSATSNAKMENDLPTVDAKMAHEWTATPRLSKQKWLTNGARPPDPQYKANTRIERNPSTEYSQQATPILTL